MVSLNFVNNKWIKLSFIVVLFHTTHAEKPGVVERTPRLGKIILIVYTDTRKKERKE